MSSPSPVREAMQALSRNAGVIESALHGNVRAGEEITNGAIDALRQASALKVADEDGYRMHPRLRDYLLDHLQLFPAYQSLTEIGSKIGQMDTLWRELGAVLSEGGMEAVQSLRESIVSMVYDISDSVERNLLLLSSLLGTRYGHVKTLAEKVSQNRFYMHQASTLATDLNRLERRATDVEVEAQNSNLFEISQLLRKLVLGKTMFWQHGLSDMQAIIRQDLFRTREVQANLRNLARADIFLRQQPGWRGWEPELTEVIPDFLLLACLPKLQAHVDPTDSDRLVADELVALVHDLPARRKRDLEPVEVKRYFRTFPPEAPEEEFLTPIVQSLLAIEKLILSSKVGISLFEWRKGDAAASLLEESVWLTFAVLALRARKIRVRLELNLRAENEHFHQSYYDATAFAPGVE